MEDESKIGYMCLTDYQWELGEAMGGTQVYESVDDLKMHRKCVAQCGIVKVKVELVEFVEPGKPFTYDGSNGEQES